MKKTLMPVLLTLSVLFGGIALFGQSPAGASPTQIPAGEYSVHMPVPLGWGGAVGFALATDKANIGWGYWSTYTDNTRDYVVSVPLTTRELATDLLRNVCKKFPNSGAIRFNQLTGRDVISCKTFAPKVVESASGSYNNSQSGSASYYSERGVLAWSGRYWNGCAHKTLPRGTLITVKAVNSGRTTQCRVDDRGPYVGGRIIDLQPAQFAEIASISDGVVRVVIYW